MTNAKTVFVLWLCCCCLYVRTAGDGSAQEQPPARHKHARTRSGSSQPHQRTKDLTSDAVPAVTAAASAVDDRDNGGRSGGGVLRKYLVRKPASIFRRLLRSGVDVVQTSMDAFQGVSTSVFQAIKPKSVAATVPRSVPGPPTLLSMTSDESTVGGGGASSTAATTAQQKSAGTGMVSKLGDTVATILHAGIAGAEQITDLGFLMGNIGTHKIRAGLEGQDGNREIFNLLVKYAASRVGMSTKGSPRQFVDDIGIISTFMADNEEVTKSISTVMDCMVNDPKVIAAMVRMAVTVLKSSPSTECILDQLPLSPSDIRLVFDVFVGSNGQAMMQTIAGLMSSLTSGPDTKEFLESMLGMMSMFKSDDGPTAADDPAKPTSVYGSLTGFFTGDGHERGDDEDEEPAKTPQKAFVKRKSRIRGDRSEDDRHGKDQPSKPDDPWFADSGKSKAKPVGSDWFDSSAGKDGAGTAQRSVKMTGDGTGERVGDSGTNVKKPHHRRRIRRRVKKSRRSNEDE